MAACSRPPKDLKEYHLDGIVVKVDADHQMVLIQHKEIQGLMGAMTMDFPVKDPHELAKLRAGEHITARVLRDPANSDFWIDNVRVVSR
ncbi:MAG: copper-binding protein [Bryobacteraceae bacterium]